MKNLYNTISLQEGNTPLLQLINLEEILKWKGQIWAKAEYQNPTGSFKDRGSILEIGQALKEKKKGIVCASTGNMAASLAAYAARNKLCCLVVIPSSTPKNKLKQALISGAKLYKINGNYDQCVEKAIQISKKKNYLLCGDYELRRKGQSVIGIELAQSKICFDAFLVPVGNGTVGCAVSEGFALYKKYPSFIGVQAKGADPITKTWQKNSFKIFPLKKPKTIATAINVGNPLDGALTLEWIKKTKGTILSVNDKEIISAQKLLAQKEGIFVEPAAAATVAALIKIPNTNLSIVLILTGHGLKGGE